MSYNQKNKRHIYLIHADDVNSNSCKGKTKRNDMILVLAKSMDYQTPDFMNDNHPFVCSVGEELDTYQLQQIIEERITANDIVYFIGPIMEEYFEMFKPILLGKCSGIAKHNSFAIRNVKVVQSEDQQSTVFDMGDDSVIADTFLGMDTLANSDSVENDGKTPGVKKNDNKPKQESKPIKKQTPKEKKTEPDADTKPLLSGVAKSKADVICALRERLHKHIMAYTGTEMSVEKSARFIKMLLKAESITDFISSWYVTESESLPTFSEARFIKLKAEATYYYKVTIMFSEDDVYSDDTIE